MTMPNPNIRDSLDKGPTSDNKLSGNSLALLGGDSKDMANPSGHLLGDTLAKSGDQQTPDPVQAAPQGVAYLVKPDPDLFSCSDGPFAALDSSTRLLSRCSSQCRHEKLTSQSGD